MYTGKLVTFGECVLGFLKTYFKGRAKWLKGVWLGKAHSSGAHIIGYQGTLFVTRSVRRWHNLDLQASIEVGPWDHGLASLGHKLVRSKRFSVPEGLVVGKAVPEHAVDHTSDEAAFDPPSGAEEAPIPVPIEASDAQVSIAGQQVSHHGVSSQAGTVSISRFPKSPPISSSPMDVSTASGSGVVGGAEGSAHVEERPEKQAGLSASGQFSLLSIPRSWKKL